MVLFQKDKLSFVGFFNDSKSFFSKNLITNNGIKSFINDHEKVRLNIDDGNKLLHYAPIEFGIKLKHCLLLLF